MKIEMNNISKQFGKKKALREISLNLEEKKIYGLLGRNGAGKTTLMQLIAGYERPTAGTILVNGEEPYENCNVTEKICFINESGNFKNTLKISETLYICSLFHPQWDHQTARYLLNQFNLDPSSKVKALSKGMESALGIVVGLSSKAPVTIFDEPYIGLDAAARKRFYELLIEEYTRQPRTFILSTHLIDEVSMLFEEVIMMAEGRIMLWEEAETLRQSSLMIHGTKESIDSFVGNKKVLHRSTFAGQESAVLFGENLSRQEAIDAGLRIESVPVQELMVYLTEHTKGEKSA
ncbi:ABC transporter ATP-binding protein [Bacillus sp. CECT 9360]|uniref:ABC transporter ATP-binding protein n=1 Tax=Bacillus sp. CECT 9360 TaxID=2845821 RepID=UPI001E30801C|nr:ABC transporter ATP-binding protein [Bacillus sp. CECT 9360]CAH0347216.1 Vitamin B12 import ATP-binding protein BtuD [Bacillus sp. CECT 9360]